MGLEDQLAPTERTERSIGVAHAQDQLVAHNATAGELGDRALRDDLAPIYDRGGVAGPFDLVEQMRGDEHGAPLLLDHRADHFAKLLDAAGIEAVGWLVEDQQQRVGQQAAGHAEALAHAHRVALDLLLGALGEPHAG
jgi:hypothetical protein